MIFSQRPIRLIASFFSGSFSNAYQDQKAAPCEGGFNACVMYFSSSSVVKGSILELFLHTRPLNIV